ncbi:MAG: UDP-N-acetylglucosamine 2-epimerase (hydrolyzing) [Firmicutes bacterium]|nr:UDP-N-acetylglucosamine 2-epimerase (hydrolyzing) [Bacillota bacterium]
MKHTLCVVTGSRAEFGILLPLLRRLQDCPEIELRLAVTGSHLSAAYGHTVDEIKDSGLPISVQLPLPLEENCGKVGMAKATAAAMDAFAEYFSQHRPELMLVLGDRYEVFAASAAAAMLGIPIAHLHGGETTEGAVDEFFRHSVTKMSYLHFTACEAYRRRVIQLGEAPGRVFNVGALGIENVLHTPLLSQGELEESLGFALTAKPYCIVTFHPVTMEEHTAAKQFNQLTAAMEAFPNMNYLITKANADAGGQEINAMWEQAAVERKNWFVTASLGMRRYLSAMRGCLMVLGNSSSGILEAPAMHIPTVNIGDRQKGRMRAESIIDCPPEREAICAAMERAMTPAFRHIAAHTVSPFGDGNTSERILAELLYFLRHRPESLQKAFYDLPVTISEGPGKQ